MWTQSDISRLHPSQCHSVTIFSLPCHFWLKGSCKFGVHCKFSHGEIPPSVNAGSEQGSTSTRRRRSLAARARRAEEVKKRKEGTALAAERARERHAKRLTQEIELREVQEAAARQFQLQLEARRKKDALVTEQHIVLGSSLITYGAGLDVRHVAPGFALRQVTIKGLPPDTREEDVVHILTRQGLKRTDFFISHLQSKDNGNSQEAAILMGTKEGVAIAIGLQLIEFRGHFLIFEVGEKAGGNTMRCNSDFLTVYQSPSSEPLEYTIIIPKQQYEAQKKQWESLSKIALNNDAHVQTEVGDREDVFIHVSGQDKKAVGSLKVRVEHMVAGERLDPEFWHPSFSAPNQRVFLDRIYQIVGVYVRADVKTRSLKVYGGSDVVIEEARKMIKEEVERLAKLETTELLSQASVGFFMRGGLA